MKRGKASSTKLRTLPTLILFLIGKCKYWCWILDYLIFKSKNLLGNAPTFCLVLGLLCFGQSNDCGLSFLWSATQNNVGLLWMLWRSEAMSWHWQISRMIQGYFTYRLKNKNAVWFWWVFLALSFQQGYKNKVSCRRLLENEFFACFQGFCV